MRRLLFGLAVGVALVFVFKDAFMSPPRSATAAGRAAEGATSDSARPSTGDGAPNAATPLPVPALSPAVAAPDSTPHAANAAACRLAMELVRCNALAASNLLAKPGERIDDPKCATLPSATPAWKLLLLAAEQGHVPSMALFADGRALGIRGTLTLWDVEAVAAYRENAYGFMVRAAEAGDGAAVGLLARELLAPGVGKRAVPYDPVRGLAYAKVLARHVDPDWREHVEGIILADSASADMPNRDRARAEAMSRGILSRNAEARLEGWSPLRRSAEAGWGCDG